MLEKPYRPTGSWWPRLWMSVLALVPLTIAVGVMGNPPMWRWVLGLVLIRVGFHLADGAS